VANQLPTEIQEFIFQHIDSLEQLEVLLLLSGSPQKAWTAREINDQLRSNAESVQKRLETLVSHGLVAESDDQSRSFRYSPATPALAAGVETLAENYRERRVKVLECIFSKPISSLRIFADSFRIRKDQKDG
jgi:hypothetical protein